MDAVRLDVLRDFREAIVEKRGGEVVVRSGAHTGRVFFVDGRIAWAVASTVKRTFLHHLVERTNLSREQLKELFILCKESGQNFGEAIVEQKLLDEQNLRALLLDHLAECFLELLCWPKASSMFVPEERPYKGSLTFELEEILGATIASDKERRLPFKGRSAQEVIAGLHRASDSLMGRPAREETGSAAGGNRLRAIGILGLVAVVVGAASFFVVKHLGSSGRQAAIEADAMVRRLPRLDSGIQLASADVADRSDQSTARLDAAAVSADSSTGRPDAGPSAAAPDASPPSENTFIVGGKKSDGRGSVRIVSRPRGARIFFDGIYTGRRTPFTMRKVPAGMEHVLMVERRRYLPAFKRFKLAPDMQATIKFSLKRGRYREKAPVKVGLRSTPEGAAVYLNRRRFKQPTPTVIELHPRRITRVELRLRGHRRWRRRIRPIAELQLVYDVALKEWKKKKKKKRRRPRRRRRRR